MDHMNIIHTTIIKDDNSHHEDNIIDVVLQPSKQFKPSFDYQKYNIENISILEKVCGDRNFFLTSICNAKCYFHINKITYDVIKYCRGMLDCVSNRWK